MNGTDPRWLPADRDALASEAIGGPRPTLPQGPPRPPQNQRDPKLRASPPPPAWRNMPPPMSCTFLSRLRHSPIG